MQIGHPEKNRIVREELEFKEDLISIQEIAKRILLHRLLPYNKKIQAILDLEPDWRIRRRISFTGSTTLRARRPVGIRLRPEYHKNS